MRLLPKARDWVPDVIFSIDHLEKQSNTPDKICDYDSLTYFSQRCNGWRLAENVNDSIMHPLGQQIRCVPMRLKHSRRSPSMTKLNGNASRTTPKS